MTNTPNTLTYSSVISRDSVRIALTIAALNELSVMACDIQNTYLTAECREKIWTCSGPEFGSENGSIMIVKKVLYGLKGSDRIPSTNPGAEPPRDVRDSGSARN